MALATTSASGMALQMPMTLCQLKSRALPERPRRKSSTLRTAPQVRLRGHQRTMPVSTSTRNAMLDHPVMALPVGRWAFVMARYRCHSVATLKTLRMVTLPVPRTSPV